MSFQDKRIPTFFLEEITFRYEGDPEASSEFEKAAYWKRKVTRKDDRGKPATVSFQRWGTEEFFFDVESTSPELWNLLLFRRGDLTKPMELELSLIERNCLPVIKSYLAKGSGLQVRLEEPWASRKLKA